LVAEFQGRKSISKMKVCKKIMLKYQIRKYEKILLVEGIREAKNRGKNIQFGLEGRVVINEDIFENIYLAQNERGQTDISLILALGAEVNYEAGRRYYLYGKMLQRMER